MSTGSTVNQNQVEAKVASLRASDFSPEQLRRACRELLDADVPLRDAIVLRKAKELADLETPAAADAWEKARDAVRRSVPYHVFALWIEPCRAFGAEGDTLILEAPLGIRAWTERRYSHLIGEALQGTPFSKVRLVAGGEC